MNKSDLRSVISNAVKKLEQGRFQEFCISYLPVVSESYKGIERHGGTVEGKTRKGTPDLIKTLDDGRQIAVGCSVEAGYWKLPRDKDKYSEWKPCSDIDKCIEKLKNVQEIVLCSNQEVPTDSPNAKSAILEYARGKTNAKITLINLVNIENFLVERLQEPPVVEILKEYLPTAYDYLESSLRSQKLSLTVDLKKDSAVGLSIIEKFIEEAFTQFGDLSKARDFVIQKISELGSRFEVDVPAPGDIKRKVPEGLELSKVQGKIHSFVGVPKIGKTTLVAQWENQGKEEAVVRWFVCSKDIRQGKPLAEDLLKNVLSLFMSPDEAVEFAAGVRPVEQLKQSTLKYRPDKLTLFIVDNVEQLDDEILTLLDVFLRDIQHLPEFSHIGMIFISNKTIKSTYSFVNEEIRATAWDRSELQQLMALKYPGDTNRNDDKYIDSLLVLSAGHPLVALALAMKNPTHTQLVMNNVFSQSVADEELSKEVKTLLFNNILADDYEGLIFLTRMSALIFRATLKVMATIKDKISPSLGTPIKLILEKFHGTVIEGDENSGYEVAPIYKKIIAEEVIVQEQAKVYDLLANEFLNPSEKTHNVVDTLDGITYAFLAGKLEVALYWANVLLYRMSKQQLSGHQIQNILLRLDILTVIKAPSEPRLFLLYCTTMLQMAMRYTHVNNHEKAIKILESIVLPSLEDLDKKQQTSLTATLEAVKVYKAVLCLEKNPVESVKILGSLDIKKHREIYSNDYPLLKTVELVVSFVKLSEFPSGWLERIIKEINIMDEKALAVLVSISTGLGLKAKQEGIAIDDATKMLELNHKFDKILKLACETEYNLQINNPDVALSKISEALLFCEEENLQYKAILATFYNLKGDALYFKAKDEEAREAYLMHIEYSEGAEKSIAYGISNYRVGLLTEDPQQACGFFKKSSHVFRSFGSMDFYGRSEGERAVTFVQIEKYSKFMEIAEDMCKSYYLGGEVSLGPACYALMAHLTRLSCMLEDKPLPQKQGRFFPEFIRGVYERASAEATPNAGPVAAFYILSKCYKLLGEKNKEMELLRTALASHPSGSLDQSLVASCVHMYLEEIILSGDEEEIKKLVLQGIFSDTPHVEIPPDVDSKDFIADLVFSTFNDAAKKIEVEGRQKFIKLFSEIEETISSSDIHAKGWWLSETSLLRAKFSEGDEQFKYFMDALSLSTEYSNSNVIIQAGNYLGFSFFNKPRSLHDFYDLNYRVLEAFSSQKHRAQRLEAFGENLFAFWCSVDYKKLYENEIKIKQTLMDGAKKLKDLGLDAVCACPVMILLLASINDYQGFAVEWAIEKLKVTDIASRLPEDIQSKINLY